MIPVMQASLPQEHLTKETPLMYFHSGVERCLHAHKVAIGLALPTTKEFVQLYKIPVVRPLFLVLALTLLAGCGSSSGPTAPPTPAPLSAGNLNLTHESSRLPAISNIVSGNT